MEEVDALAAAGLELTIGVGRDPAAMLEELMMASFVLLVHLPRVFSRQARWFEWTMPPRPLG